MEDITMRNILDELYDFDLFHLTEIADIDSEYKSAMDRLIQAETELLKVYPDCKTILVHQAIGKNAANPYNIVRALTEESLTKI